MNELAFLRRIQPLIKISPRCFLPKLTHFYSQPALNPSFSTDEDEPQVHDGGESLIYRQVLRKQRPTTVIWRPELSNSVTLIGRVVRPLDFCVPKDDKFGVYTFIEVKNPRDPCRSFRMRVDMWEDVAGSAVQHLKPNDNIYVSGFLWCFEGNYKVTVKELYYVGRQNHGPTLHKPDEESQSKACQKLDNLQIQASEGLETYQLEEETGMELGRYENHLLSWQQFFCKPWEWWDKRKSKRNSVTPDFKNKFSGENLWLRADDPPWIKGKLQLLDMEIAKQRKANAIHKTDSEYHLWQVFFSNPHEWWDNRKNKKSSQAPDFKHKDTGEALWISPDDPSWVKKQLQLLDSAIANQCLEGFAGSSSDSKLSTMDI